MGLDTELVSILKKQQPETLSYRVLDPVNENFDLHGEEWKSEKPMDQDRCHLLYIMAAVMILNAERHN